MGLRLGDIAPDFSAETTEGKINFHEWKQGSWAILFSHPDDFTPVCTTELGSVASYDKEWKARGVKVIGLSANDIASHEAWIKDIESVAGVKYNDIIKVSFPIIGDKDRSIATAYDMLDYQDPTNIDHNKQPFTIRSVFIIDPKNVIRLTLSYPAQVGRSFPEILRVVDSLQLGDKYRITTPVNWKQGEDVIVHPSVKSGEEAEKLFPGYETVTPYLRFAKDPSTRA